MVSHGREATLLEIVPDQSGCLEPFPSTYSASEIGHMILGSGSAGIHVSMWGCLFKEACDAWPSLYSEMLAFLGDTQD